MTHYSILAGASHLASAKNPGKQHDHALSELLCMAQIEHHDLGLLAVMIHSH